jgi:hypothetical protein
VLLEQGNYRAFKLVDGSSVSLIYANRVITNHASQQLTPYSFPFHSAGPFGEDVDGPWMVPENFIRLLAFVGFGWKDVHATNASPPDASASPNIVQHLDRLLTSRELAAYTKQRAFRVAAQKVLHLYDRMFGWLSLRRRGDT